MGGFIDDFDDDLTVPAGHKPDADATPFRDDFDDDLTLAAAPVQSAATEPAPGIDLTADDFDDDLTLPATPVQSAAPEPAPVVDLTTDEFDDDVTLAATTRQQALQPLNTTDVVVPSSTEVHHALAQTAPPMPKSVDEVVVPRTEPRASVSQSAEQTTASLPIPPATTTPWTPPKRPTAPPAPTDQKRSGPPVGVVIGVAILLLIVAVVLFVLLRVDLSEGAAQAVFPRFNATA